MQSIQQPQRVLDQLNKYDVNFNKLDLNVNNTNIYISGNATIVSTILYPLDTFYVELNDSINITTYMVVDSVFINGSHANRF